MGGEGGVFRTERSKCKGPGAGVCLLCLGSSLEASVAEIEQAGGMQR